MQSSEKMNLKALWDLTYGVYVIGSAREGKLNAQIANTVFQVTSEPPRVAVSINKKNLTYEYIHDSKFFTASALCQETPLPFIGRFGFKSGRDVNKLDGTQYKLGVTGAPIIMENATSYVEVRVDQEVDVGTHAIFIGEVVAAGVVSPKVCMTYAYYQQIKRGVTPEAAPTYSPGKADAGVQKAEEKKMETVSAMEPSPEKMAAAEKKQETITQAVPPASGEKTEKAIEEKQEEKQVDEQKGVTTMAKYKCTVCGYIYDPALGDPDSGIKPGTPFESLPDSWTCPVCGASKSDFEKLEA